MKKNFLTIFVITLFSVGACSQSIGEAKVPAAVKEAFKNNFSKITGKWEKEEGRFEVNFKKDGKNMSVLIGPGGAIVETETAIAVADLLPAIGVYMKTRYKGATIREAARIVKANGETIYEAAIHKQDVLFDAKGNFIKEAKD